MQNEMHESWMEEKNPDGWDDRKWKAYTERLSIDPGFRARAEDVLRRRHEWIEEQMKAEIGKRKVSAQFRIRLRRQLSIEAEQQVKRLDPLADGWLPSKDFDPIAGLGKRMRE